MTSSPKKQSPRRKKLKKKKSEVKNDKVHEPMEDLQSKEPINTSPLVRMKRGVTEMNKVVLKKALGKRYQVEYTKLGVPRGRVRSLLQSYIGVLARTMVPISIANWPKVPLDVKEKIWEEIEGAFIIAPESKKLVLSSAASKWRQFKSKLTSKYILPNADRKKKLKKPPKMYDSIEEDEWKKFVASRLSKDWLKLHTEQKERTSQRKYHHRLSRKGYVGLEEELMEAMSEEEELDRSYLWKKAREGKDGKMADEVAPVASEIDNLLAKKNKGELAISGSNDVLTMALKTPEHSGRVRGIGGNVNPSTYFHLPRQRRQSISKATFLEHQKLFEKTKRLLEEERQKERAYFEKKIAALEARLNAKVLVTPSSPVVNKGDCHSKTTFNGNDVFETSQSDQDSETSQSDHDSETSQSDHDIEELQEIDVPKKPSNLKIKSCKLAVGSISNIVALGTIIEDNDSANMTVHGIPLKEGHSKVSVDVSIDANALLPVPIPYELENVGEAVGSYVSWPKNLIVQNMEKKNKKYVAPVKDKDISMKGNGLKMVPSKCKALYQIAKLTLDNDGKALMQTVEAEVFGVPRDLYIFKDDIIQLMEMQWLSANCIVAYMWYLYEIIEKSDLVDTFGFVDPARVVPIGVDQRIVVNNLVDRWQQGKSDRIFFMPYNPSDHWMLTVINEEKDIVYIVDSLERDYPKWKETVNNAIKLFNGVTGRHGKKAPRWIPLLGAPKQVGGVECGYYVMRFMKEIIEDPRVSFAQKWGKMSKRTSYSQEEIDEVRNEWSEFVTRKYL